MRQIIIAIEGEIEDTALPFDPDDYQITIKSNKDALWDVYSPRIFGTTVTSFTIREDDE